ncbi:MAG: hypothetical protein ACE37H_03160 [Phycisphaeraceae bacterium]
MPDDHDPPFDPESFDKTIKRDDTVRALLIAGAVLAGAVAFLLPGLGIVSTLIAPMVLLGLWLWVSVSTARVGRELPRVGALIPTDPGRAGEALHEALRMRPVMRWARLLTYHRLATLRHLQRRFDQTASICLCLLNQPLKGPAAAARPHLLLMLAEAQLEQGNTPGAFHALAHLQQARLGLGEALQRLAIQTRYELMVGAHREAVNNSRAKIELAELMPAVHCATMHAMLATAAHHQGQDKLAAWLWERTRLLASPTLLDQLEQGGFGVGIVEADTTFGPDSA